MKKIFLASFLSLSLFLAFGINIAQAQSPTTPGPSSQTTPGPSGQTRPGPSSPTQPLSVSFRIDNPFSFRGGDSLYGLVQTVVNNIILPIGGVLCVLAFIYAGFMYVTARGDTAQIKTAHNALLYASIGTAILLGSWVIANAIRATVNQIIS